MRRWVAVALALEGLSKWSFRSFALPDDQIRLCEPIGCIPTQLEMLIWPLWFVAVAAMPWRRTGQIGSASGAAAMTIFLLADRQNYSNHGYLFALTLVLLSMLETSDTTVPRWPVQLLRWQIVLVYFFASLQKLRPESLSGQLVATALRGPVRGIVPDWSAVFVAVNLAAFGTELVLAIGLANPGPHWRRIVAVGVAFHIGTLVLVSRSVGMIAFALLCVTYYPLFGAPDPNRAPTETSRLQRLSAGLGF